MKITLEEEDLKGLEDALMRAIFRAIRMAATRGYLGAAPAAVGPSPETGPPPLKPDIPVTPPSTITEPPAPPADEERDDSPPTRTPYRPPWGQPMAAPAPTPPEPERRRRDLPIAPRPQPPERRARRTAAQVVRTVGDRPQGYVPTDELYDLIDTPSDARALLSQWIMNREVPAVIVANYKPPTKGLPGRLMVEKNGLLQREALRKRNAALPPMQRTPAPIVKYEVNAHK